MVKQDRATGFRTFHSSMHDCITYILWSILAGLTEYSPTMYILMMVQDVHQMCTKRAPNVHQMRTHIYNQSAKPFNRGFTSMMVQYTIGYTIGPNELATRMLRKSWHHRLQILATLDVHGTTSIRYMPGTSFSSAIAVLISAVLLHPSDPGRCKV